MKPNKDSREFKVPMTIDVRNSIELDAKMKVYWSVCIAFVYIIVMVVLIALVPNKLFMLLIALVLGIALQYGVRIALIREGKYKKAISELEKNDFQMAYSQFWDILEIDAVEPFTVRFKNGATGYFVTLESGSKIGKPSSAEYDHYEAIADALRVLSKRKLQFYHVDFMDNINKDGRITGVRNQYTKAPPTIKKYLMQKYDFLETRMTDEYTSYDVIVIYTPLHISDEFELYEGVREFSEYLVDAHYIHVKMMDAYDIENLAKTLLNSDNFNSIDASESLASTLNSTKFLRKIYTIDEYGNKEVHNLTRKEKQEKEHATKTAKKLERQNKRLKKRLKEEEDEEVELL